jgi:hypothetical protein
VHYASIRSVMPLGDEYGGGVDGDLRRRLCPAHSIPPSPMLSAAALPRVGAGRSNLPRRIARRVLGQGRGHSGFLGFYRLWCALKLDTFSALAKSNTYRSSSPDPNQRWEDLSPKHTTTCRIRVQVEDLVINATTPRTWCRRRGRLAARPQRARRREVICWIRSGKDIWPVCGPGSQFLQL